MGFLPNGTSDKLGNRYEGRWVVRQLLHLLAEQIRSVQLEAIGDMEEGVDLWIERSDGLREAHQCKAFNTSKPNWSIADLRAREVLAKAVQHLGAPDRVEFWFVSTILATELEDLSRNTRDAGDDCVAFFDHHVVGNPRQKHFDAFCKAVGLDSGDADQRSHAFDYLKRLHVRIYQDDRGNRDELNLMAGHLVSGAAPAAIVATLADIAQDNLHKAITLPALISLLQPYGLRLRLRTCDPLVTSRFEELRDQFIESIEPHLAAGKLIPRSEADAIEKLLATGNGQPIVVHGAPGDGKSGVLYQVALSLRKAGACVCALRLDRKAPKTFTAAAYGGELGLPGSPVACLCDVSGGQRAILILDQLDALRWTHAHAEQGLDICKTLLREAQAARQLGANVEIIIACRTFDLERDPEIRAWLNNNDRSLRVTKVEVSKLPADVVHTVVENAGIDPSVLRPKQTDLLTSVQRLAMWVEIVRTESVSPAFDSSTQLLREFWRNRRQKLEQAGCDPDRRERVLSNLLDHMESNACLTAPASLLGNDRRLINEMQSSGVVSVRDQAVTFGHQANLDFLIAERAVSRMAADSFDLLQWLGSRDEQSLFRREQLRQVLFLLADEQHANYLQCLSSLLANPGVRFHLRQLALETLGQIQPLPETMEYVCALLADEHWREHVELHVVLGNVWYITQLHERGQILPRFASANSAEAHPLVVWLGSVRRSAPTLVAEICNQAIDNHANALALVADIIGYDGQDTEADELFDLRIACLKHGSEPHYVDWGKMVAVCPDRSLRLFDAMLIGWMRRDASREGRRGNPHIFRRHETKPLLKAARHNPQLAWRLLWPCLKSIVAERRRRRRQWFRENKGSRYWPTHSRLSIPHTLYTVVTAAGRRLAGNDPRAVLRSAGESEVRRSRVLSAALVTSLARLPNAYADQAIEWLLADQRRLHCGAVRAVPRWRPAAKLISALSPYCSSSTFQSLEQSLLRFRDPLEKRRAKQWIRDTRDGCFRNGFGIGQHHLLPALDENRRSLETLSRVGVLNRKFGSYPRSYFLTRNRTFGGFTRSPLDDADRFTRLSDKAWLQLIANVRHRGDTLRRQSTNGRLGFVEATVESLSRSFGRAAFRSPERFAQIGLRLSKGTHPEFVAQLLQAVAKKTVPTDVPEAMRDDWQPAKAESVAQILDAVDVSRSEYVALWFCWAIHGRGDVDIANSSLAKLLFCAQHLDPQPDEPKRSRDQDAASCGVHRLEEIALNSVRAVAATAITDVLFRRSDLFAYLEPQIHALINDDHPAVRVAALRICFPVWNMDRSRAVDWFVQAVTNDCRIAASQWAPRLLNHMFPEFQDRLEPLVREMVHSPIDEVALAGAERVTACWLFYDLFQDAVTASLVGNASQRQGVARVVSQFVFDVSYTERCLPVLRQLLDDEAEEVQNQISHVYYRDVFFEAPWAPDFLHALVRAKAQLDRDSLLIRKLKDLPGSVDRFADAVFAIVERITAANRDPNDQSKRPWDIDSLIVLLLRLYERASGDRREELRQRCLDAWDDLLESRAALAWALTRGLDQAQP